MGNTAEYAGLCICDGCGEVVSIPDVMGNTAEFEAGLVCEYSVLVSIPDVMGNTAE